MSENSQELIQLSVADLESLLNDAAERGAARALANVPPASRGVAMPAFISEMTWQQALALVGILAGLVGTVTGHADTYQMVMAPDPFPVPDLQP